MSDDDLITKQNLVKTYESQRYDLARLFKLLEDDEATVDPELDQPVATTLDNYGGGVEVEVILTVWLEGGGPTTYLEVKVGMDPTAGDWEVHRVKYISSFGGAAIDRSIDEDSPYWKLAERALDQTEISKKILRG
jgi:hypothetical protein